MKIETFLPFAVLLMVFAALTGCESDVAAYRFVEEVTEVVGDLQVDEFTDKEPALDVLFSVDHSCSMVDDATALQDAMPGMYEVLNGPGFEDIDWRVSMIRTDPTAPMAHVVRHDHFDPASAMEDLLDIDEIGNGWQGERGLDAALESMDRDKDVGANVGWDGVSPYEGLEPGDCDDGADNDGDTFFDCDDTGCVGAPACPASFHREEADLLIIFVSDESDSSHVTAAGYLDESGDYKDVPYRVISAAIVLTDDDMVDGCGVVGAGETQGEGYIDVSTVVRSICEPTTWPDILEDMDAQLQHNAEWRLSQVPLDPSNPAQFSVVVDLEPWEDWTYSATDNTVYPTVELPPEAAIVISYITE